MNVDDVAHSNNRPLEEDTEIAMLKFDDPEARSVFHHSSAHILGSSLEKLYGCHLCAGPPVEQGFYYDMYVSITAELETRYIY